MTLVQSKPISIFVSVWFVILSQADCQILGNQGRTDVVQKSFRPAASPAVQDTTSSRPEITLNGLTTILGDKRALFKVQSDYGGKESYFLAEGQSAGGIQLLSVDIKAGRIKVNNHGVIQTIALCQPPDLSTLVATAGNVGISHAGRQNYGLPSDGSGQLSDTETAGAAIGQNSLDGKLAAGVDGLPGDTALDNKVSQNDNGSQNAGASNPGTNTTTSDSGSADNGAANEKGIPNNLRASREFERLRIQTASGVYNGTDEPIPLTPLTPPGTPMALIGPDRAWFPN